ncbi:hypothetical protein BDW02DRAFT_80523 [Decorospora gaudefroyi]|uniref:Uncharacterized protein n=1 Tax=Decorospora gaudefroyi TaxID=184978 RepID=A0A6A5K8Q2_9PLEO|nr:hypothetical protein BDW02DRAFT_80523 [Decorospora gaudefroyi]
MGCCPGKVCGGALEEEASDTCDAQRVWGAEAVSTTDLSMVASIALFVVLDRLCVADTAGRCPRSGAWGLLCYLVTTAILVYDLGAHAGWGGGMGQARSRSHVRRAAPSVTAGGRVSRQGRRGASLDALIGGPAGSSFFLQTGGKDRPTTGPRQQGSRCGAQLDVVAGGEERRRW